MVGFILQWTLFTSQQKVKSMTIVENLIMSTGRAKKWNIIEEKQNNPLADLTHTWNHWVRDWPKKGFHLRKECST
jgi:hypothetical protein